MDSNVKTLIFDLDGTLCKSTKQISTEMYQVLDSLADRFDLWIVTGTTYERLCKQVPQALLSKMMGAYTCLGTSYYNSAGDKVHSHDAVFSTSLLYSLREVFDECNYPLKEKGITERNAMINFSVISRDSSDERRQMFADWDRDNHFREYVVGTLSKQFPEYNFAAGGMVSIDITVKGFDKAKILENDQIKTDILFFGDKCDTGGNDRPLAQAIVEQGIGSYHAVSSPEDTLTLLKKIRG
mgnify:CR=1 FL=1